MVFLPNMIQHHQHRPRDDVFHSNPNLPDLTSTFYIYYIKVWYFTGLLILNSYIFIRPPGAEHRHLIFAKRKYLWSVHITVSYRSM